MNLLGGVVVLLFVCLCICVEQKYEKVYYILRFNILIGDNNSNKNTNRPTKRKRNH